MWPPTVISLCCPYATSPPPAAAPPLDSRKKCTPSSPPYQFNFRPLKLRASSFFDYPLASRIVVKNLPYSVGESTLLKEFSNFGLIAEVKLVKDEATMMSKGYAFIQYTCQEEAVLALENMDHKKFDGRLIYVELARPGKEAFHGVPRTCGPPAPTGELLQKKDEVLE